MGLAAIFVLSSFQPMKSCGFGSSAFRPFLCLISFTISSCKLCVNTSNPRNSVLHIARPSVADRKSQQTKHFGDWVLPTTTTVSPSESRSNIDRALLVFVASHFPSGFGDADKNLLHRFKYHVLGHQDARISPI